MSERSEESGIGIRLRTVRERRGLSREALAFHSGISWSAIAQIEGGRRANLRLPTLIALAGVLAVSIDYLVSGQLPSAAMLEHRALLYEDEDQFLAAAVPFLSEAAERSEAALAVTSAPKIDSLRQELGDQGDRIEFADQDDWYRRPAAALAAYHGFVRRSLADGVPWVRILGEPVWTGRSAVDIGVWARYESLLNLVFSGSPVTLICPYGTRGLDPQIVEHACTTHPHLVEGDMVRASPTYCDPDAFLINEDRT